MSHFWVFHNEALYDSGVILPSQTGACPRRDNLNGFFWRTTTEPPGMSGIYHFGPFQPLPNHTWVEVCHRARSMQSGFERNGSWFAYCKGSGIWAFTGVTRAFDTHGDAIRHF